MMQFEFINETHIEKIVEIEELCFSMPWSRKSFEEAIYDDSAIYVVAIKDGEVCGYAGLWQALDEANITNVAVANEYRKQGIGTELVKHLTDAAKENGVAKLFLEVRESNISAQSVYEKCGFRKIGIRKHFYEKPVENALVMTMDI